MKKISVIDLGSNSAKLTVASVGAGGYEEIFNAVSYVRLSEDLTAESNTLKPEPVLRTVSAIKEFADKSVSLGADEIHILSTEAVRRADNSIWFSEIVRQFTGCELNILSGEQEALYDCVSISADTGLSDFVLVDTGGGSTEIALFKNGSVKRFVSMPWGAVTLTSMFSCSDSSPCEDIEKMTAYVADGMASLDWLSECTDVPVVGVGGSLRVYNKLASDKSVSEFLSEIVPMTEEEKLKIGIPQDRVDIMSAGLVPAHVLLLSLDVDKIIVSNGNIRDGFIRACVLKN